MFTIIAVISLLILYFMIFMFSSTDGEASGELSRKISGSILRVFQYIFNMDFSGDGGGLVEMVNHPVRKTAHFLEYALLGFFSFGILLCWCQNKRKGTALALTWIILSAAIDEIHQYFVPGRYCSIKDVMLDTLGGGAGMLVIYICYRTARKAGSRKGSAGYV